ncbi:ATP-binding protein [uncultured Ferrimonas sp.]|uniref:ATP-binding protein n=1 Tax=uncultured Ferrimonas sp. TaxID=432640 RepID=UPI0026075AC3|nr:ATP-binding protein [uncultured Ferrimonas sp.]
MDQQAFRLRRIIIIDSFWKGKVNEIDFDGHTQLEGTNGAGKTSLMRLLPLFYGMRPGDIVSKVDQSKNFVDYYLPRESSLLVYEYQRADSYSTQQCCMVASCAGGRNMQYKLIDAPYQQQHFISADHRPFKVAEIERNYGRNVFKSNYLNVTQYRQVIQNLREGRTSANIRELQRRFAFSHVPMPHVERVVNGTIEKNLDFDAVKKMLVAITADFLARGQGDDHREPMQLNKDEIGAWLSDIQASREVHAVAGKIERWQGEFTQLEQHLLELRHLTALLADENSQLSEQQQQLDDSIKAVRASLKALESNYDSQRDQLKGELTLVKDQLHAKQTECDRLDEQKANFDDDDAASYQLKADEKGRFSSQLQDVEQIIVSLEGDVAKIADKYRDLLHKLELQLAQEDGDLNRQMAVIRDNASRQLDTIQQGYQTQRRELEQQQDGRSLELKQKLMQLQHQQQVNADSRQRPAVDPTIEQGLQQSQQQLASAQQQRSELLLAQSEINKRLGTAERDRDRALNKLGTEQNRLRDLSAERDAVSQQLNPADGSLHAFLDQQPEADGWKQTIGALLAPQLLARTDLAPNWSGDGLQSLYGVKLDLSALQHTNPLAQNEAQLQARLAELEQQHSSQEQLLSDINALLEKQGKEVAQWQGQFANNQQQERKLAGQIEQLQQQLERQHHLRDESIKQRLLELDADAEQLRKQLQQLKQQQQQHDDLAQDQLHELHNGFLEQRSTIETDRDLQLDTLAQRLSELTASTNERRKDYKRQQKQALDQIDPDGEIDRRHQERRELNAKLQQCAEFENKARIYADFISKQYSQRDALGQALMSLQQQANQGDSALQQLEQDYQGSRRSQRNELDKLKQKAERSAELLAHLERASASVQPLALEPQLDGNMPRYQAQMLPDFVKQNLDQFSLLEKTLTKEISSFASTLRIKHGKSSLYESWVKLVADNDRFEGCETVLKYRAPLTDLLQSAGQLKASTGLLIQTNANMINEFYQHLANFDRRIKLVGRKLSERVTELAKFEAFAEISVGTVTKLDQLEYWRPLKSFSECYELAKDQLNDANSDIPEELITAMRDLARVLPAEGVQLEHNDLFDLEFVITEKGQVKRARNARQLKKVSSTGLSYLAMLSLFAGLLAMLRGDSKIPSSIILPVDELGELAAENIKLLLDMFDGNAIQILSASPATDRQVLALYQNHYKLKDSKIYQAHVPMSKLEQLMAARAAKQSEAPTHV